MPLEIRAYCDGDLDRLKEITVAAFDSVSIDHNIDRQFGPVGGHDWRWRKARHIEHDVNRNPDGVFVAVLDDAVVGYVSTWLDREAKIGNIPNLALSEESRGQGIGRRLLEHALDYFRREGMTHAKIETLDQNPIGQSLYPSLGFREVARQIHFFMRLDEDT